jgi:presenilin-like A22 family membrane protease
MNNENKLDQAIMAAYHLSDKIVSYDTQVMNEIAEGAYEYELRVLMFVNANNKIPYKLKQLEDAHIIGVTKEFRSVIFRAYAKKLINT